MFKLSFSMTLRDWRAGELRFLMVALALAVASLSAVQFFTDRIGAAMNRDAHGVLGADMLVSADNPLAPHWAARAQQQGLRSASTVELDSMAFGGDSLSRLVSVKAVSAGYPLRGTLKLQDGAARTVPAPGTAWVDPALLSALNLRTGSILQIGELQLRITRVIAAEPDRSPMAAMFAPRVMMSHADLQASGLVQGGSFASFKLLVAGEPAALAQYKGWLDAAVAKGGTGVRIETLQSAAADSGDALARGQRFLSLVGLLSAMLASLAVAMAARRFMLRHADACAMLRCLGLTHRRVTAMYLIEFLLVGLAGSAIGVLAGFASHFVLLEWLGPLVSADLGPAGWMPAVRGMVTGVLLLIGFGLPPLLQLRDIPHNRLLRGETVAPRAATVMTYVLGLGMFGVLLVWQAGDVLVGLLSAAAFGVGLLVFAAVAWAAVASLRFVPAALERGVWRLALADLRRRPVAAVTQVVALSLGLMALLLLTVVRGDLLAAWKNTAPPDAPNHVILNIEPEQRDTIAAGLHRFGAPVLYPMLRSRLTAKNGQALHAAAFEDKRAKGMLENELTISSVSTLPEQNTLVAGSWFAASSRLPELSMSEGAAKALGLKLGDRVGLMVAAQEINVTLTSLRKFDNRSRRSNFSLIINPVAAVGLPATFVASVYVPRAERRALDALVRSHPNLTLLDTGAMIEELQRMLDQVAAAIEFLFLFTLASGLLVLYATLLSSQDARMRQAAILRALGASRVQLSRAQWLEYTLTGALAGVLAALGATAGSWALARFAFNLEWQFSPLLWLAALAAGGVCALAGGWSGLRAVLTQSPLTALRSL